MTDKDAIAELESYAQNHSNFDKNVREAIDVVLNLIENQKAEIEQKDKQIDLMAVQVYLTKEQREKMKEYIWTSNKPKNFKNFVKQYLEKKVKEDK